MKLYHHKDLSPSFEKYVFADRNVFYRSEMFEPSQDELARIKNIKSTKVSPHKAPTIEGMVKCIIDTDLGTDFDDTLAVLYALNLDNLEILGITTNYGPTQLRSYMVHQIVDSYHRRYPEKPPITVISGSNFQIGTHREIFLKGNEGKPFLSPEKVDEFMDRSKWESNNQTEASDFIANTINSNPEKTIKIISIGIMTNIALAFKQHPEIIPKIQEMVVMGGGSVMTKVKRPFISEYSENPKKWEKNVKQIEFPLPEDDKSVLNFVCEGQNIHLYPNHNFSGDSIATVYSFSDQIRIKIIPFAVTCHFWLSGRPIQYLKDRAEEARSKKSDTLDECEVAGLIMEEWFELRNGQNGQCPHDTLTVHEAVFGSDMSPVYYVTGTLVPHKWAAFSTFVPNDEGNHYLGVYVHDNDAKKFLEFLGKKITNDYEKEKL